MGQKVNPISNRLGVIRGWDSNWFGGKKYGDTLLEDSKLRKYLNVRLAKSSVSRIVIERTLKLITITVCTSRPGVIIGKGGAEVDKLKEELKKITDKDVQINIFEVKRPELDAQIVASTIAGSHQGGCHRCEGVDLPRRGLRQTRSCSQLCNQRQGRPSGRPRQPASRRFPQAAYEPLNRPAGPASSGWLMSLPGPAAAGCRLRGA